MAKWNENCQCLDLILPCCFSLQWIFKTKQKKKPISLSKVHCTKNESWEYAKCASFIFRYPSVYYFCAVILYGEQKFRDLSENSCTSVYESMPSLYFPITVYSPFIESIILIGFRVIYRKNSRASSGFLDTKKSNSTNLWVMFTLSLIGTDYKPKVNNITRTYKPNIYMYLDCWCCQVVNDCAEHT